jgi:hypothetical protein
VPYHVKQKVKNLQKNTSIQFVKIKHLLEGAQIKARQLIRKPVT